MTGEDFVSPQEIARRLKVTDRAILDMIAAGKLPGAVRVGTRRGVWRVPQSSVDAYLAAQAGKESTAT